MFSFLLGDNEAAEAQALQRRSTIDGKSKRFKAQLKGKEEVESSEEEGIELLASPLCFRPLHIVAIWEDPVMFAKMVSVATLLPSGVKSQHFSVRVVDDGLCLELKVIWPDPLADSCKAHKHWISRGYCKEHHPRLMGFREALKNLKRRIDSDIESTCRIDSDIESTCRILLPFQVQTCIPTKWNLAWEGDESKMVHVDLSAQVEEYAQTNDNEPFRIS